MFDFQVVRFLRKFKTKHKIVFGEIAGKVSLFYLKKKRQFFFCFFLNQNENKFERYLVEECSQYSKRFRALWTFRKSCFDDSDTSIERLMLSFKPLFKKNTFLKNRSKIQKYSLKTDLICVYFQ